MRRAARERVQSAQIVNVVRRFAAEQRIRDEAIAPWAPAIQAEVRIGGLGQDAPALFPAESARQLRALAREMTVAAKVLRVNARLLDAEATSP